MHTLGYNCPTSADYTIYKSSRWCYFYCNGKNVIMSSCYSLFRKCTFHPYIPYCPEAHQNDYSYVCWLSRPTFRFTMQEFSIVGSYMHGVPPKTQNCQTLWVGACLGMGTCSGQAPQYLVSKVRTHLSMTSFAAFFAGSIKFAYYKKQMLQKLGFLAWYSFPLPSGWPWQSMSKVMIQVDSLPSGS